MDIYLTRYHRQDGAIIGDLRTITATLASLENEEYAIPSGTYDVLYTYSPKFKCKLPLLLVEGRSGIRIHAGNTKKDSTGCILVGLEPKGSSILYSKIALSIIIEEIETFKPDYIRIHIKDKTNV